ncbi:conserved hypothetical protein [Talaromyces stipitatus ATCC 10500]|uniref:Uncharacterized protein n=1 Tax=Talaromyces stipitatus (strain ATCC 10500 / CBS 375.48 / QM 6759 / NRRL 1006) TaxID=441959 RepID=B8LX91_TALSN|nr:uncharacterized protein TSTA_062280 [Talaromyces stipitatus ATCC 10500]EED22741.1 conserved hypothetical protein [Talaromyces stipitatus ATCC 10500]
MASWLHLTSDSGGWCLEDSGRLRQAVQSMKHPTAQYPLIVYLLGGPCKRQALRVLLPYNNTARQGSWGISNLHLRNSNIETAYPEIFIDGILEANTRRPCRTSKRNDPTLVRQYRIHRMQYQSYAHVRDHIFHQCILPFIQVLCIFADELQEPEVLEKSLSDLASTACRNEAAAQPHLLVVLTDPNNTSQKDEVVTKSPTFDKIRRSQLRWAVVDLRDRVELSAVARFEPLRLKMRQELETARIVSEDRRLLFCATHLEALMQKAVKHAAQGSRQKFDIIAAARANNPVPQGIEYHLTNFLRLATQHGLPRTDIVTLVASALAVDAYPPNMHAFDPRTIFRRLYARHCHAVWRANSQAMEECETVESFFASFASRITRFHRPVDLRRRILGYNLGTWAPLKTNLTCLYCLLRGTCEVLPCGHAICDVCIRRFAAPGAGEYLFRLETCDLCQSTFTYTVRQVPPTQRPNILVLDGGGVRGIVTLGYLRELASLRNWFQLVVGTSVGGLIAIYEYIENYSPEQALEAFVPFARLIFPRKQRLPGPIDFFGNLARNLLSDGSYNSETLDSILAEAFGDQRRLYEASRHSQGGCRVAITASQVEKNGELCLFTNYRGPERPEGLTSYDVMAPANVDDEPFLWQVARCAVAALGYFQTKRLAGLGTFQDGGICANCPVRVALRESSLLWPHSKRPNVVVSIGTGYLDRKEEENVSIAHHLPRVVSDILSQGYIKRAKDAFLNSAAVDGTHGWKEARDSIPDDLRNDVFRLDVALPQLPELDDAGSIDGLASLSYEIPKSLIHSLLSTSFFFELDTKPLFSRQSIRCEGSILCSRDSSRQVLTRIESEIPGAVFMTDLGENLGMVQVHDGCEKCGYYRKRVTFGRQNSVVQIIVLTGGLLCANVIVRGGGNDVE